MDTKAFLKIQSIVEKWKGHHDSGKAIKAIRQAFVSSAGLGDIAVKVETLYAAGRAVEAARLEQLDKELDSAVIEIAGATNFKTGASPRKAVVALGEAIYRYVFFMDGLDLAEKRRRLSASAHTQVTTVPALPVATRGRTRKRPKSSRPAHCPRKADPDWAEKALQMRERRTPHKDILAACGIDDPKKLDAFFNRMDKRKKAEQKKQAGATASLKK